jgi:hypothetical protein
MKELKQEKVKWKERTDAERGKRQRNVRRQIEK